MKLMIKIFVLFCLVFIWSGSASGIDKSKKSDQPAKKKTITVQKKNPDQQQKSKDTQSSGAKQSSKTYDNFVDRNNNGIDDRAEKISSKQPKKKVPAAKPTKKVVKP